LCVWKNFIESQVILECDGYFCVLAKVSNSKDGRLPERFHMKYPPSVLMRKKAWPSITAGTSRPFLCQKKSP
jgi:hypothetical protein